VPLQAGSEVHFDSFPLFLVVLDDMGDPLVEGKEEFGTILFGAILVMEGEPVHIEADGSKECLVPFPCVSIIIPG
jgi:hypothetical protein